MQYNSLNGKGQPTPIIPFPLQQLLVYLPFHILFTHFYIIFRCKYTHFSNTEHYKITHFYANNKQSTDNQAVPIGDYPPEDIQNVRKKKSYSIRKITNVAILRLLHIHTRKAPLDGGAFAVLSLYELLILVGFEGA